MVPRNIEIWPSLAKSPIGGCWSGFQDEKEETRKKKKKKRGTKKTKFDWLCCIINHTG
jgi:hypothetical protein